MDRSARLELLGPGDGVLLGWLLLIAALDGVLVFAVPPLLGYPRGGHFLLVGLPLVSDAHLVAAALAVPALWVSRARIGPLAGLAFVAGLAALGAADAYLWTLCVASV